MTGVETALCIALLWAFYSGGLSVFLLLWLRSERKAQDRRLFDLSEKMDIRDSMPIGDRLKELREKWRAKPASRKGGEER